MEDNPCYEVFLEYFVSNYTSNVEQWAACYRARSGITTNNYIEAFHSVFKKYYLKGKVNNRMDKCLNALLKYARDLLFKRAKNLTKNAYLHKEKDIKKRHELANNMSYEIIQINEQLWQVKTGTDPETEIGYEVTKAHEECPEKCRILCRSCRTCPHIYMCTCYDYMSAMNMCKHIHFVLLKRGATNDQWQHPDISMDIHAIEELLPHNNSLINPTKDEDLINDLETLISLVKNPLLGMKDEDATKLREMVNTFIPKCSNPIEGPSREPHNKKAQTQMRFFTSKKRSASKPRLSNPTNEESSEIKRSLKE